MRIATMTAVLFASMLFAPDDGGGTGSEQPDKAAKAAKGAKAGKETEQPAAEQPAGGVTESALAKLFAPLAGTIEKLGAKVEGLEGKLSAAEKREQDRDKRDHDRQRAAQNGEAAKAAGAKDPDYFAYLVDKEMAAKGDKFDMEAFVKDLKTKRTDLFGAAPAATTTGAPPALPADKLDAMKAEYNTARDKGDVGKALKLKRQLAANGIPV